MKVYIQEFIKGGFKALGGAAAIALMGWLALRIPKFRDWIMHTSPSKSQMTKMTEVRLCLLLFAAALIILDLYFLLRRSSKGHLAVQQELQTYLHREPHQPIYVPPRTVGRPSNRNAFELLKWFYTLGPRTAAGVQEAVAACHISEAEARAWIQELHVGNFIYTVEHAPGDWNGRYAITLGGRHCVEQYGT